MILVVGDRMVDKYIVGTQFDTNPEGTFPRLLEHKLWPEDFSEKPGGAENVAMNLESLGVKVGSVFGQNLHPSEILTRRRVVDSVLCRVLVRIDSGVAPLPIQPKELKHLKHEKKLSAVVVADYGKGSVTDVLAQVIRELNVPTFVSCKKYFGRWAPWAECVFINTDEDVEFSKGVFPIKCRVVTAGASGAMLVVGLRREEVDALSPPEKVKSVCGAGDTALAAFVTYYLSLGADTESDADEYFKKVRLSGKFAMKAAAQAVQSVFTATVRQEIICPKENNQYRIKDRISTL